MSDKDGIAMAAGHWSIIRAGVPDSDELTVPSLAREVGRPSVNVRYAIGANGEARLLLPLRRKENVSGFGAGTALSVAVIPFTVGKDLKWFLDLTCNSNELEPVFGEVVDEIVRRIGNGQTCMDAARSTLDDFRSLLARPETNEVERTKVAGLLGELILLDRLLDLSPGAWRVWSGPLPDRHDFRSGGRSLEVKTSLRAATQSLISNGIAQLEAPTGGTLHLVHFVLEPVSGGKLTVLDLGTKVLSRCDDPDAVRNLISQLGCPNVAHPVWNAHCFRMERETAYRIDEGFPRLVPSMMPSGIVPAGIDKVSYSVSLAAAEPFRCTENEFEELLGALAE